MKMTIAEAKDICQRWINYCDQQKQKSITIQRIASDVRNKVIDENEGRRLLRQVDRGVHVHDGALLYEAVKFMMKEIDRK